MTNISLIGEHGPNAGFKADEAMQFAFDYDGAEVALDDALGDAQILDDVLDEQRLKLADC